MSKRRRAVVSRSSGKSQTRAPSTGLVARLGYATSLTTIAILLHLFKIPFPLAPFLKYDLAGVPLAVLALISLRDSILALPVFAIGLVVLGADVIGALMKILAEASTFAPLALIYKRLAGRIKLKLAVLVATTVSALLRAAFMCTLNYAITPYWLVWAGWAESLKSAYELTIAIMPYIALFNVTLAIPVVVLAIAAYRLLARAGVLEAYKQGGCA